MTTDICISPASVELTTLEQLKTSIAEIRDPQDAAEFARKCEAAAKLYDHNELLCNKLIQAAVAARIQCAELIRLGREAGIIAGNGRQPKETSKNFEVISPASLVPHPNDVSRNEKLRQAGEDALDPYYAECLMKGKRITVNGAISAAKKYLRDQTLKEKEAAALPVGFKITGSQSVVSCDSVITDPPYGITTEPWEPEDLESFTRDWLRRWDESNAAWFVSFFSQAGVWDMRRWMDEELRGYTFHHLCIWHYGNGMGHKAGNILKESWEPIFVYRRHDVSPVDEKREWDWKAIKNLDCIVEGAPRPTFQGSAEQRHPCQKPVKVMQLLATAFCTPGGLIADPFCGSGTTGIGAMKAGCRFHGIETNAQYRKLAKSRISLFGDEK